MSSIQRLATLAGTALLDVDDSGNVTAAGAVTATGGFVGAVTGNTSGTAGGLAAAAVFASSEVTGTGSSQNTAHGLGAVPALVWASVTEDPAGAGFDVTVGTHTTTNAVFTVTSGVKYRVYAIK